jgi:site-specific recombinase XerD
MLSIPPALQAQFEKCLRDKAIPKKTHGLYKKWLRYYLDFCKKYDFPDAQRESLPPFLRKLEEKKQTKAQQEQAAHAIALYHEILDEKGLTGKLPPHPKTNHKRNAPFKDAKQFSAKKAPFKPLVSDSPSHRGTKSQSGASRQEKPGPAGASRIADRGLSAGEANPADTASRAAKAPVEPIDSRHQPHEAKRARGASWQAEYTGLANEIQVRHYSPKTLRTYRGWVRKFQTFTRSKAPELLSADDVKEYLTFLAVRRKVSSSTQNQAFNALLFFFRHVLHKEFGKIDGVVRAKRKPYIPVVLTREEIDAILAHLSPPYDLVVKLLYGCGLRLFECLNLRVHCWNFDAGVLTIHDGKGQRDRTVPIPQVIFPEIQAHLESLKDLHQRDLDRDYDGVFLVNALEEKYKNAARDFIWQWFFPAKQLTYVEKTGERRRYTIFMKRMCNRQSSRQLVRREFVRERQPTLFATVLQATSCRPITISGRFRNYLGTVMCELQ